MGVGLISTKTRVDLASLNGTGIHPLPPGALATVSRVGTRGAPTTDFWWVPARAGSFGD